MMQARLGEFSQGVVGSPFYSLCDRVSTGAPTGVRIPQAALLHAFREAGWIDCGRIGTREYQTKKHIFCAPNMMDVPRAELRRMIEDKPASPYLKAVTK
jgi:hypothetical protein